jgi:hypothetical protein
VATVLEAANRPTNMHRALTWVIVLGAASGVLYVGRSILRSFANLIAWSAVLAIIRYPLQQRLVQRTGRVAHSAFITSAADGAGIRRPDAGDRRRGDQRGARGWPFTAGRIRSWPSRTATHGGGARWTRRT